ncbi:hypothetical protein JCM11641_000199 [Rhodosporidiobolus odoratus]
MSAYNNTNTNTASTGYGAEQGERGLGGQAPTHGSSTGTGASHGTHSGSHLGSAASSGLGSTTGAGYDPASHQASEVGRHPVGAATHPTHPVAGAEAQDYSDSSLPGSHSHSTTGDHQGTQSSSTAGQTGKDIAKHLGAAASNPTHPGYAAAGEDARKGGHLTDSGARRDVTAPGGTSTTGTGLGSHSSSHTHPTTAATPFSPAHAVTTDSTAHGAHSSHSSSATTGQDAKDIAKHPGAASSNPAHPGDAAASEDARKGGHLTDTGARRDPTAPTPAGASSTTGPGLSSSTHPSSSTSHTGPHSSSTTGPHSSAIGATGTHEGAHKPTIGDKVAGAVESLVGKVSKNPAKVEEGTIRKTEGKEAAQHASTTGAAAHMN